MESYVSSTGCGSGGVCHGLGCVSNRPIMLCLSGV